MTETNGRPPSLQKPRGRECTVGDCSRKHYAKGLCQYHYNASLPPKRYKRKICSFDGCSRPVNARGLCKSHDEQEKAGKELTPLQPRRKVIDGYKECSSCLRNLPVDAFNMNGGSVYHRCRECMSIYNRMHNYGISFKEARILTAKTSCDACGTAVSGKRRHVDHCHESGVVRGVLCHECNVAAGMLKDDPARLRALADYLERPRQLRLA